MLFSPNFLTPVTVKIPHAHLIIIQQEGFIQAIYLEGPIQNKIPLFTAIKINSRSYVYFIHWNGWLCLLD